MGAERKFMAMIEQEKKLLATDNGSANQERPAYLRACATRCSLINSA
jgi:hypothetical protein